jgi:hypothetical protein
VRELRAPQEIIYLSRQKSLAASDAEPMLQRTRRHAPGHDLLLVESQVHASADVLGEPSRSDRA